MQQLIDREKIKLHQKNMLKINNLVYYSPTCNWAWEMQVNYNCISDLNDHDNYIILKMNVVDTIAGNIIMKWARCVGQ